tara:strand:+ start:18634 stop:19233 length:600 start_codon:yes stop_codon:yes gene_type:complete
MSVYVDLYMKEVIEITKSIDKDQIDKMVKILSNVSENKGRIFFIGVGGGAGNATHAVNDFRKIANIESYTPTDNVSELTARINDDGWDSAYTKWLQVSNLNENDVLFIFSVGGGNLEKNISVNIVESIKLAEKKKSKVIGIVGRDGGYTGKISDACVIIPTVNPETITPHTEAFQAVIWHLIVSHPDLKKNEMKWEEVT